MFLIDFSKFKDNNKLYGGNAGLKRGIFMDNANWIIKYPQENGLTIISKTQKEFFVKSLKIRLEKIFN